MASDTKFSDWYFAFSKEHNRTPSQEEVWNAALAQPAPVQVGAQQAVTDEQLAKAAYKGYDDYWTEDSKGIADEAWAASAKAVLALASTSRMHVSWDWLYGVLSALPITPSGCYEMIARHDVLAWIDEAELRSALAAPVQQDADALEYKFSCLLDHATGGKLSKSSWALSTMQAAVDEYIKSREDAAIAEREQQDAPAPSMVGDAPCLHSRLVCWNHDSTTGQCQDCNQIVDPLSASRALLDVLAERQRQINVEGWTPEHDDAHNGGEMALAASCYAAHTGADTMLHARTLSIDWQHKISSAQEFVGRHWPWARSWWKPKDRRSNLVRAGALLVAEIERLDRAAISGQKPAEGEKV